MTELKSASRTSFRKKVKGFFKDLYLGALDFVDSSARRRNMMPPRRSIFVGDGDYKAVGLEFRDLFIKYGGMKPSSMVLDVGCGTGRMAVPLTDYLSKDAEYKGFDIVKEGVDWCQKHITSKYPNFHFNHCNIYNYEYNPDGVFHASSYKFPYEENSFDFVFLTSVFTHMFPPDVENYMSEIARVLKTDGTCFITFFLMNSEAEELILKKSSTQLFTHDMGGYFTTTKDNPEAAIAFSEPYIREMFRKRGLAISEPIQFGSWCRRPKFLSYQDIVIAKKQ